MSWDLASEFIQPIADQNISCCLATYGLYQLKSHLIMDVISVMCITRWCHALKCAHNLRVAKVYNGCNSVPLAPPKVPYHHRRPCDKQHWLDSDCLAAYYGLITGLHNAHYFASNTSFGWHDKDVWGTVQMEHIGLRLCNPCGLYWITE